MKQIKYDIVSSQIKAENPQTVEEKEEFKNKSNLEILRLKNEKVFNPKKILLTDFADSNNLDEFFNLISYDFLAIEKYLSTTLSGISDIKDAIKERYNNAENELKATASKSDVLGQLNQIIGSDLRILNESFDNLDDLSMNDKPLYVNTFGGKLYLNPSSSTEVPLKSAETIVSSISNGHFADDRGILNAFDLDSDSFCEYRKEAGEKPLDLQFTLKLSNTEIINRISLIINNMGTQNWAQLLDISASRDGVNFYSVYESDQFYKSVLFNNSDSGFLTLNSDENSQNKKFVFDFQPSKVKYLRFKLRQDRLHPELDEYVLGINEISAERVEYAAEGSVTIAKPVNVRDIKNLSINTDQVSRIDSQFLKITYQISFDQSKWYDIQPTNSTGNKPRVLRFNQPWLSDSVDISDVDSNMIYLKIIMSRVIDTETIENYYSSNSTYRTEYKNFPSTIPHSFTLDRKSNKHSISILSMPYLGVGKDNLNVLTLGKTNADNRLYDFGLPFDPADKGVVKIASSELPRMTSREDMHSKLGYYYDTDNKKIYINFPSKDAKRTPFQESWLEKNETNDDAVKIEPFDPEDPYAKFLYEKDITITLDADLIKSDNPELRLSYNSDGIKSNFEVWKLKVFNGETEVSQHSDIIPRRITKIKLSAIPFLDNANGYTISLGAGSAFRLKYIDGVKEFINAPGDFAYSIDFNTGWLYLSKPYEQDISITYWRKKEWKLNPEDFTVSEDGSSISIREWAFDPDAHYKIFYNMTVKVDSSFFEVSKDGKVISMSEPQLINIYSGKSEFQDKKLKVIYSYNEDLKNILAETGKYITPILKNVSIIYSVEL